MTSSSIWAVIGRGRDIVVDAAMKNNTFTTASYTGQQALLLQYRLAPDEISSSFQRYKITRQTHFQFVFMTYFLRDMNSSFCY